MPVEKVSASMHHRWTSSTVRVREASICRSTGAADSLSIGESVSLAQRTHTQVWLVGVRRRANRRRRDHALAARVLLADRDAGALLELEGHRRGRGAQVPTGIGV